MKRHLLWPLLALIAPFTVSAWAQEVDSLSLTNDLDDNALATIDRAEDNATAEALETALDQPEVSVVDHNVAAAVYNASPELRKGDKFKINDEDEDEDKSQRGYRARQNRVFHWGFKGGFNITTYDSDADDAQAHMGQWGMIIRWCFGRNRQFCAQFEAFYARMGVRSLEKPIKWFPEHDAYITGEDLLNQKFRLHLLTDNVQEAFVFKYYTPIKIAGSRGVDIQGGFLLSERFDYTISTSSPEAFLQDPVMGGDGNLQYNDDGTVKRIDSTLRKFARGQNKFTTQWLVGIGYDNPTGIGIDLRFQQGITPVWKRSGPQDRNYNRNSHDRVWSVSFCYLF